jgi:hypothetical protein
MNQNLLETFKNAKEWLNHAESKNAMLIAFNGAAIFGLVQFFDFEFISESTFLSYYLIISIGFLVISLLLSFLSFVPELEIVPSTSHSKGLGEINSLYFEHLKELDKESIYKAVTGLEPDQEVNKIDLDLAQQIQQVAKIASRKYMHFTIAVWITGGVFFTCLLVGIIVLMIQSSCS